ncbi:hypothetical protein OC834_005266 [Tilletia horrida]|nr:hypothetical protein OC834_005266 [Tilletia horrida]
MSSGSSLNVPGVPSSVLGHLSSICNAQRSTSTLNADAAQLRAITLLASEASIRDGHYTKLVHGKAIADLRHLQVQVKDELSATREKVIQDVHVIHAQVQTELDGACRRVEERLVDGISSIEKQLVQGEEQTHEIFEKMLNGVQECVARLEDGLRISEEDKIRLTSQLALFASWASAWHEAVRVLGQAQRQHQPVNPPTYSASAPRRDPPEAGQVGSGTPADQNSAPPSIQTSQ